MINSALADIHARVVHVVELEPAPSPSLIPRHAAPPRAVPKARAAHRVERLHEAPHVAPRAVARPGDALRLRFDFSDVAALRESRDSTARIAIAGLRAGALSVNDARRRLDLEPVPGGDAIAAGGNTITATPRPSGFPSLAVERLDQSHLGHTVDALA